MTRSARPGCCTAIQFIGVEREAGYLAIADARINHVLYGGLA